MSDLLNDYYTIAKANELLEELFSEAPLMMDIIKGMSGTSKRLFAALCDGKTITTTGYSVKADIYIHRASAPIKTLREYCLPIDDKFVQSVSTLGNPSQVKVFFLSRESFLRLTKNPKWVIEEYRERSKIAKYDSNKNDLRRIYNLYGEEDTLKLIEDVIKESKK